MACAPCIAAAQARAAQSGQPRSAAVPRPPVDLSKCKYNIGMVNSWKDLLFCVRDKGIFTQFGMTKAQLNSFLGIVLSAVNYPESVCYLDPHLDSIKPFIVKIINTDECT